MTGMQNIETAIGHDHLFVVCLGLLHQSNEMPFFDNPLRNRLLLAHGMADLGNTDCCRTQLANHYASSHIGKNGCVSQFLTSSHRRGKNRDHGITCTSDIENLTRTGRNMQRFTPLLKQSHPLFTPRNQ